MHTHLFIDSASPVPAIRIVGDVDFSVRDAFREALRSLPGRASSVAIDFSECTFFDASVLSELGAFARSRTGQTLAIVAPGAHAKRLLQMTGFDHLFAIADSLDDFATDLGSGFGLSA